MSDEDIFEALVEKVRSNGYEIEFDAPIDKIIEYKIYYKFIFDHDFAKALWGDLWIDRRTSKPIVFEEGKILIMTDDFIPVYLYQLSILAQQKEPLKYLEQFVSKIIRRV